MSPNYDFYSNFQIEEKEDVDNLVNNLKRGKGKYSDVADVLSRIMILSTALHKDGIKDYARVGDRRPPSSGLKAIIHSNDYNNFLVDRLSCLSTLGIITTPDISSFPKGSWIIEFPITLAKPYISRDDAPLYIIENPIRKDKVFGIPFISAMAWKGNLRWTMMKRHLESLANEPDNFAKKRLRHTFLFGTEKGMEDSPKGWAKYLDELCPNGKESYRDKLKAKFVTKEMPNVAGMLYFYPTFWNKTDMEVINPHDRETKTGKNPIYFESVPAGSEGIFRLIYMPLQWIGLPDEKFREEVFQDLQDAMIGIREMMLTYGFSAKKSSGYGIIKNEWDGKKSKLIIKDFMKNEEKFGDFEGLEERIKKLIDGGRDE